MRKRTLLLPLWLFLLTPTGWAQDGHAPVSKDEAREAIALFRKDPASAPAKAARSVIVQFARESPDVEIHFAPKVTVWMDNPQVEEEDGLTLLAAYIAGNVQAQLDKGKARDDAMAGITQVIATYRQLQKAKPLLKIAEVDHLVELQNDGKLAAYLKEP